MCAHLLSFPRPAAVVLTAVVLLSPCAAAEKGKVTVKKIEYGGWKNNLLLSNGDVELVLTLDVGPRVISYRLAGGKNVFKEYPEQLGKSGEKEWVGRGGHRVWVGPEDLTRTYAPDNRPVKYQEKDGTVILTPPPDKEYGIQKELAVTLAPHGSHVTVVQKITNVGDKRTRLAVWALTVMAPGGVEIIPLPPHHPHPGPPQNARSAEDFAPNVTLVLWPFFDFKDPRWTFGSRYITLRQDPKRGPTKIGLANAMGWVAYLNNGTLFIKRTPYQKGKTYPDRGSSLETFSNQDMVEIESMGPLNTLAPGKSASLTEHWELAGDVKGFKDEAGIDKNVLPHVKGK